MSRGNFDKYITVFSPEGALYQVEYAFKAVKYPGLTTIAVRGKDCAVVATQRKVPDKLMKRDTITSLYAVDGLLGCCATGRAPDGKCLVQKARQEASDYRYKYGVSVPIETLAKRMGDLAQVRTQEAGMRPMGAALTFIGMDQEDGTGQWHPKVFKVDPAGYYVGYGACATGAKEVDAIAALEKRQKATPFEALARDEAAMVALAALQHVAGQALKAADVELGCVTEARPAFHLIDDKEVEAWLTAIAERD